MKSTNFLWISAVCVCGGALCVAQHLPFLRYVLSVCDTSSFVWTCHFHAILSTATLSKCFFPVYLGRICADTLRSIRIVVNSDENIFNIALTTMNFKRLVLLCQICDVRVYTPLLHLHVALEQWKSCNFNFPKASDVRWKLFRNLRRGHVLRRHAMRRNV